MRNHTVTSYTAFSKFLHWIIALLVLGMLSMGFFLDDLPESYQGLGFMLHKSTGITILMLMVIRLFWIVYAGRPALPTAMPRWEKLLSRLVQTSFYVLLLAQPLCGWVMSVAADRIPSFFGLIRLPIPGISPNKELAHWLKESHEIIAWVLIVLIILHIAGALKHHFINKDAVLRSMIPNKKSV